MKIGRGELARFGIRKRERKQEQRGIRLRLTVRDRIKLGVKSLAWRRSADRATEFEIRTHLAERGASDFHFPLPPFLPLVSAPLR